MTNIAVLGLGAMGSRMAENLLKAGHNLTVWNRSPAAMGPLVDAGAVAATTPRHAVEHADVVLAMLRDDEASRQVWLDPETGALIGMKAGAVAIESSTLTPDWVRELGKAAKACDVALLEAPVVGSRPQAAAGQLVFLVAGGADTLARAEPLLQVMGGSIHYVGDLGQAALVKLTVNALLGIQVAAYAELIGMLKDAGADVAQVLKAVAGTPTWAPVAHYLTGTMLAGDFAPQFPITLIEKDFGYVESAGGSADLPVVKAVRAQFRKAMEAGIGDINMTGLVKLYDGSLLVSENG